MTVEVRPDLVTSLGVIRGDVVHHLAGVSRYRAMRNLEQTMADIAEFQDLVTPLRDVRGQIERSCRRRGNIVRFAQSTASSLRWSRCWLFSMKDQTPRYQYHHPTRTNLSLRIVVPKRLPAHKSEL